MKVIRRFNNVLSVVQFVVSEHLPVPTQVMQYRERYVLVKC